jgi:hypothetical protein
MDKITIEDMCVVKTNESGIIGKMAIFGLSNALIEREKLAQICKDLNLPIKLSSRISPIDAFRSATSDIRDKKIVQKNGELYVHKIYCRDNEKSDNVISRELVCETLGQTTNGYIKLANICYRKDKESFNYTIENHGTGLNADVYCEEARDLFELYKVCVGRNQLENFIDRYLDRMDVLKIQVHGKVYFIPKKNIHMVDVFEVFIESINDNNKRDNQLKVNSLFVADNTKQRGKIAEAFYHYARQEIQTYMDRFEKMITSNSSSPTILERWANKAESLKVKKAEYEVLLQRELGELEDDFQTLCLLVRELKLRAKNLRLNKLTT